MPDYGVEPYISLSKLLPTELRDNEWSIGSELNRSPQPCKGYALLDELIALIFFFLSKDCNLPTSSLCCFRFNSSLIFGKNKLLKEPLTKTANCCILSNSFIKVPFFSMLFLGNLPSLQQVILIIKSKSFHL